MVFNAPRIGVSCVCFRDVDTNPQITKDTTSNFQKGQSSQVTKPGPTKPQDNINKRRSYKPEHLKFFLPVFLNG